MNYQRITTWNELAMLPEGSVILSQTPHREVYQKTSEVAFYTTADNLEWLASSVAQRGPFLLLWNPEENR